MKEAFPEQVMLRLNEIFQVCRETQMEDSHSIGVGGGNGDANSVATTGIYELSVDTEKYARQPVPDGKTTQSKQPVYIVVYLARVGAWVTVHARFSFPSNPRTETL